MTPLQKAEAAYNKVREEQLERVTALKAQVEEGKNLTNEDREALQSGDKHVEDALKAFDDLKSLYAPRETPNNRQAFLDIEDRPTFGEFRRQGTKSVKSFKGTDKKSAEERAYEFGHFLLSTCSPKGNPRSAEICEKRGIKSVKAMSEGVNANGGVLVPEDFVNDIIVLRETYGVFRQYADIRPMIRDNQTFPRRTGGVTTYYPGEAGSITDSTPSLDRVTLIAKKLAALGIYSSELDEDAVIDLGAWIADEISYGFAYAEDLAGFNGDGTSTYGRMVGVTYKFRALHEQNGGTWGTNNDYCAGLVVGSGNAYSELVVGDFLKCVGRIPQYADTPNARWFMHRFFYFTVALQEAIEAGGTTMSEIINGNRTPIYLGYPVTFVQVMPKVEANSQVCSLFGDLKLAAMLGSRREIEMAQSTEYRFSTDELAVRGTQRYDINVHDIGNWNATAASREAGPLVGLLTANS